MNAFWNSFETLVGLSVEPKDLTFVQISLRGIIVFLATLIMIRFGHKRLLTRRTPFDAILLVILAAVLSRAINGSAAFFATLGGGVVLVLLHRLFAHMAYRSHRFGILVKGSPDTIVRDGKCDFQMMRTCASMATSMIFRKFDSHAWNAAGTSALSRIKRTSL